MKSPQATYLKVWACVSLLSDVLLHLKVSVDEEAVYLHSIFFTMQEEVPVLLKIFIKLLNIKANHLLSFSPWLPVKATSYSRWETTPQMKLPAGHRQPGSQQALGGAPQSHWNVSRITRIQL